MPLYRTESHREVRETDGKIVCNCAFREGRKVQNLNSEPSESRFTDIFPLSPFVQSSNTSISVLRFFAIRSFHSPRSPRGNWIFSHDSKRKCPPTVAITLVASAVAHGRGRMIFIMKRIKKNIVGKNPRILKRKGITSNPQSVRRQRRRPPPLRSHRGPSSSDLPAGLGQQGKSHDGQKASKKGRIETSPRLLKTSEGIVPGSHQNKYSEEEPEDTADPIVFLHSCRKNGCISSSILILSASLRLFRKWPP